MRQQKMYSFRHEVLDLYIVSVCEQRLVNTLNTLSTHDAAILTSGSAFFVNKELMLVFMHRRCIRKVIMSGHDFGKIK